MHERLGLALSHDCARRLGAAVAGGTHASGAAIPERVRRERRVDLVRLGGLQSLPRGCLDEGALPELPRKDQGFRRLPLSGVPADRRRGQCRPRVRPLTAPSSRDRGGGARGASVRKRETAGLSRPPLACAALACGSQISRTTLPKCVPRSKYSCASRTRANAKVLSMITFTWPLSSSGQACALSSCAM